jgi:hypothetical protein
VRSYQCYLRDRFGIATVEIIESADDGEAKQQAREMLAKNDDRYRAVEVWNRARQVDVYPSDAEHPTFVAAAAGGNGGGGGRDIGSLASMSRSPVRLLSIS